MSRKIFRSQSRKLGFFVVTEIYTSSYKNMERNHFAFGSFSWCMVPKISVKVPIFLCSCLVGFIPVDPEEVTQENLV